MRDRVREQWEALGRSDPYWAVLSHPGTRGGRWDPDAFFATGEAEIAALMDRLAALDATPVPGAALDFGCGVGRLSRALASRFERVVGVDVSEPMLAEARRANAHLPNLAFRRNGGHALDGVDDASVDLVCTNLVLQHMPPDRQLGFLLEFVRVLRPGGVMVAQTPDRHDLRSLKGWGHRLLGNRGLNAWRRLRHGRDGVMELHCLPRRAVLDALAAAGATVLDASPGTDAGRGFVSLTYVARR